MVTELFSQTTTDTKRNLLFVSILSLLISCEIIDIFEVSTIKAVLDNKSNIFILNVILLAYLNIAAIIRIQKDNATINMNDYRPSKQIHISKIASLLNVLITTKLIGDKRLKDIVIEVMDITDFEKRIEKFHLKNKFLTQENISEFANIVGETRKTPNHANVIQVIHNLLHIGMNASGVSKPTADNITNSNIIKQINALLDELSKIDELESNLNKKRDNLNLLDSKFPNFIGIITLVIIIIKHFFYT